MHKKELTTIVVAGECMMELARVNNGLLRQSFAGDVYNTAVYLKRLANESTKVSLLTAIGCDSPSHQMKQAFAQEAIDTSMVFETNDRTIGTYLIDTNAEGERSFSYWRDNAAAKQFASLLDDDTKYRLANQCNIFYFSGITLAVLEESDRHDFWQLIKLLSEHGVKIVFDSNYRAKLWRNIEHAQSEFIKAFLYSDIVFAGVEDFEDLYQLSAVEEIISLLHTYPIQEIIIKNGCKNVIFIENDEPNEYSVQPVADVVDTTSAGDSFNGGYLAARTQGLSMAKAIEIACDTAAIVIQHSGAIIDATHLNHITRAIEQHQCHNDQMSYSQ